MSELTERMRALVELERANEQLLRRVAALEERIGRKQTEPAKSYQCDGCGQTWSNPVARDKGMDE